MTARAAAPTLTAVNLAANLTATALRVGAVVAVVDEGELAVRLGELRPRLLVAWHAMAEAADDAAQRVGTGCLFVMPGEFERLLRAVPADRAVRHRDDADVAGLAAGAAPTPRGAPGPRGRRAGGAGARCP